MIDNTKNLLNFLIKNYIYHVDVALDLTAGNGFDSKNILEAFPVRKLYAFDIQKESRVATMKLLEEAGLNLTNFEFIMGGHENVLSYIEEEVDLAVYNLGYLPKASHEITTEYKKVIKSLEGVLQLLSRQGVIFITFYPGHEQGREESLYIPEFLEKLNQREFSVLRFEFINQKNNPPFCIMIQKK